MRLPIRTLCAFAALVLAGRSRRAGSIGLPRRLPARRLYLASRCAPAPQWRPRRSTGSERQARASPTMAARPTAARERPAKLVAAKVQIVVGFLCSEAIEAALADPEGSQYPDDHGRRAHRQPDRPQKPRPGGRSTGLDRAPTASARRRAAFWHGSGNANSLPSSTTARSTAARYPKACASQPKGGAEAGLRRYVPAAARQPDRPGRTIEAGRRDACLCRRRPRRHRHHGPGCRAASGRIDDRGRRDIARRSRRSATRAWHIDGRAAGMVGVAATRQSSQPLPSRQILAQGYVLPAYAAVEVARCGDRRSEHRGRSGGRQSVRPRFLHRRSAQSGSTKRATFPKILTGCSASTGRNSIPSWCPDVQDRAAQSHYRCSRPAGRQRIRRQAEIRRHRRASATSLRWRESRFWAARPARAKPICSNRTIRSTTVNAIVLSGGSAFGLDAASGVQAALREAGIGFRVRGNHIPIVPAAILFDLANGGDKDWGRYPPYRELGYEAAQAPRRTSRIGTAGAGTGALTAGLKGGLGSASTVLDSGITHRRAGRRQLYRLGDGRTRQAFLGGALRDRRRIRRPRLPLADACRGARILLKFRDKSVGANTTIAVIATDAVLTAAAAKRLAIAAHDGFARAIWPAHTPADGDLVFALATGASGKELVRRRCH